MGPWRALMGRARWRPRYLSPSSTSSSSPSFSASLSFSSLSLTKVERCPLASDARFETPSHESHEACARLNECIWPGLGLGFSPLILAQKNARQNVEASLEGAKDFFPDSSSKELKFSEGSLQNFEQKKAWLIASASPAEFAAGSLSLKTPWLNAGASLDDTRALLMGFLKQNAPNHADDRFPMCDSAIRAPGFPGLGDLVIYADSVKRKRKKKMNKHKHRKLRRLARKSRK